MLIAVLAQGRAWAADSAPEQGAGDSFGVVYAGRVAGDATSTRIFVDFDRKLAVGYFLMENPNRLVIEAPPLLFRFAEGQGLEGAGLVTAARYGAMSQSRSRIVLTLSGPISVARFETVEIEPGRKYRLVVDIGSAELADFRRAIGEQSAIIGRSGEAVAKGDRVRPAEKSNGRFTVVIDPGHGGIDGGAIGRDGTQEKDLTLAVAKLLRDEIADAGPFDVKLTRDDDLFMSLRERVAFSHRSQADLTIAVHADTVRQKFVRGATVYTLSRNASDELAGELAQSENLADLVAGLEYDAGDDAVGDILADLTARETGIYSRQFAEDVIREFQGSIGLIKNPKRSAEFRVLKTADIPAALLELGYLSNAEDEAQMTDPVWQASLAKRVAAAVAAFFEARTPE